MGPLLPFLYLAGALMYLNRGPADSPHSTPHRDTDALKREKAKGAAGPAMGGMNKAAWRDQGGYSFHAWRHGADISPPPAPGSWQRRAYRQGWDAAADREKRVRR